MRSPAAAPIFSVSSLARRRSEAFYSKLGVFPRSLRYGYAETMTLTHDLCILGGGAVGQRQCPSEWPRRMCTAHRKE
eukprot:6212559-Pleurochrysis_carterae.AAC.3